ncbi:CBO0543 family protein [Tuberibacillus sp. Marseille-P3662]|uniref:CBO0543 family protein n=1 Tax=Tuberibacillus sp. Marseille-P3662 TaxID=1965358 RepID=UPI000A1CEB2B|nr:CBO0543 family protein [Tuberibacillus sp. Marseille-P3662]
MDHYYHLSLQFYNKLSDLYGEKQALWKEYVVFNWHWWLGIALVLIPIIIWIKIRDRKNTYKLLISGAFASLVAIYLDSTGHFYHWFDYQYDVFPAASNYLPWDFVLIPVSIMLFIQYQPQANPFLKGFIYSALLAFLGLPLLTYLDLYSIYNWNYIYSFIILYIIFLMANWIYKKDLTH